MSTQPNSSSDAWLIPYETAVLETDDSVLAARIRAAEVAILTELPRLQSEKERNRAGECLARLASLKQERLGLVLLRRKLRPAGPIFIGEYRRGYFRSCPFVF